MARVKQLKNPHRQHHKRTSWTRFHLPLGQDWPAWSNSHPDEHRGPLVGVAGCEQVWLGRKVDDPEQAALIILWYTEDALKNFQDSPACAEFLRSLPENDVQTSITSGALLQDLSLGDADSDVSMSLAPSAPSSSRFLTFQWHSPFRFEENLKGRITFTAFEMPYTGGPIPQEWRTTMHDAFNMFVPRGCEDLRNPPKARMQSWTAWAWVNTDLLHLGQRVATEGNTTGRGVMCQFRRWNGYSGATPEREEASATNPLARESWAQRVETVIPPVTAWEQERWDINLVPRYVPPEDEERIDPEEDPEYEQNMKEFLEENLPKVNN